MARKYKGLMKQTAKKLFALKGNRVKESQSQRDEMAYTLRLSDQPRMKLVAQWCFDPIYHDVSFAKIIEKLGMDWKDIAREYKAIKKAEGEVAAAKYIPVLMEQTAQEALSRDVPCRACGGTGEIDITPKPEEGKEPEEDGDKHEPELKLEACAKCDGSGQVHVKGDIDRLKLMFDTFGLVGKGPQFVQNLDLRTQSEGEKLGDLAKSLNGIVDGTARVKPDADEEPVQ